MKINRHFFCPRFEFPKCLTASKTLTLWWVLCLPTLLSWYAFITNYCLNSSLLNWLLTSASTVNKQQPTVLTFKNTEYSLICLMLRGYVLTAAAQCLQCVPIKLWKRSKIYIYICQNDRSVSKPMMSWMPIAQFGCFSNLNSF